MKTPPGEFISCVAGASATRPRLRTAHGGLPSRRADGNCHKSRSLRYECWHLVQQRASCSYHDDNDDTVLALITRFMKGSGHISHDGANHSGLGACGELKGLLRSSAEPASASDLCFAESFGYCERITAATPATAGAAMEVPLKYS